MKFTSEFDVGSARFCNFLFILKFALFAEELLAYTRAPKGGCRRRKVHDNMAAPPVPAKFNAEILFRAEATIEVEVASYDVQKALCENHGLEGICCSFALDWAKKVLAAKVIDKVGTYSNAARLKKIAKNQKKLFATCWRDGSIHTVAKQYNLLLNHAGSWGASQYGGAVQLAFDPNVEVIYYVSCATVRNKGHGFCIRNTNPVGLADSNTGVYRCGTLTFTNVFDAQYTRYKDSADFAFSSADFYTVALAPPSWYQGAAGS
jgi:hypothetical protein